MTTLRIARRRQFVRLDSRAVNDDRLSYRARGVHAWLMEKPDDWTVNAEAIAAKGKEGRDAIRTCLKELEDHGYLVRRKSRRDDGTWATETVVYEHPDLANHSGLSAPDDQQRISSAGKSGALLNGSKEPDSTKEETQPSLSDALDKLDASVVEARFARFWEKYPRKTDKGGARKAYAKAAKKGIEAEKAIWSGVQKFAADPNLPEQQFIPHASTWLNGERWLDGPLPTRTALRGSASRPQQIDENRDGTSGRVTV